MLLPLAILSCCGRSGTSGGNVQKHQSQERAKEYVITDTTNAGLIIYTPTYSRIALECGTMPEQANESIIFAALPHSQESCAKSSAIRTSQVIMFREENYIKDSGASQIRELLCGIAVNGNLC